MDRHATAFTSAPQALVTTAAPRAANLSSTVGICLILGDVVPDFVEKDIPWEIHDQDAAQRHIEPVPPFFMEEDTAWFFTTENLREEAEADRDIAERKVARFSGVEDLIRDLRS